MHTIRIMLEGDLMNFTSLITVLNVDGGESGPSLPEWHSSQNFFSTCTWWLGHQQQQQGSAAFSIRLADGSSVFSTLWRCGQQRNSMLERKGSAFQFSPFKRLPASNLIQWFIYCSCHLSKVLWTQNFCVCISEGFSSPWSWSLFPLSFLFNLNIWEQKSDVLLVLCRYHYG